MLNLKKKIDQKHFLNPPQKIKVVAAILNFSKTLKKSPAHLHIMGNVIVKFE